MNVWAVQYIYATGAAATRYILTFVKKSNFHVVTVNDDAYGFEIVAEAHDGVTVRVWCESYPVLCLPNTEAVHA